MSATVQTVTGPVESSELGLVLPHEHLYNDVSANCVPADDPAIAQRLSGPVRVDNAWLIRDNPYHCEANCRLDDPDAVVEDLVDFARTGGQTVIDLTPPGLGRNADILADMSRQSGVQVVMGSGWYLEQTHPREVAELPIDELAQTLIDDFDRTNGPRPGVIGEIGISPRFTEAETKALRAACIAQRSLGVPIFVHLPGWKTYAHRVLDIAATEMGVDPASIVLCHMDPTSDNESYQLSVAARGVMLEFDMLGMPFDFRGEGICPHPEQAAGAIKKLIDQGHCTQLLLSHDVFLKVMLRRFGGNGLSYVPVAFSSRLVRIGVSAELVASINPKTLFDQAAQAAHRR
jgi:phosphotriesterase-related protein